MLGGVSGRFDHIFGTLNALYLHKLYSPQIPIFIIDGDNVVTILFEVLYYFNVALITN